VTRPTLIEVARRRAWGITTRPVREIPTSELICLLFELRGLHRTASLPITYEEWWLFDATARREEIADEIDRRLPLNIPAAPTSETP